MFTNLKYPDSLIKSTISHFVASLRSENPEVQAQSTNENTVHRVVLPFKDQKSADAVREKAIIRAKQQNRSHSSTCLQESQNK